MKLDRSFTSDYVLSVTADNNGSDAYLSFARTDGSGGSGTYLGTAGSGLTQDLVFGGAVPNGEFSINNSNTGGVDATSLNSPPSVTTGLEFAFRWRPLGRHRPRPRCGSWRS